MVYRNSFLFLVFTTFFAVVGKSQPSTIFKDADQMTLDMPSNFFFEELDNGLDILVIEDSTLPLVNMEMAIKFASINENNNIDGIARLNELLMFKASENYPENEQFQKREIQNGIVSGTTSSIERTSFYLTSNKNNIIQSLNFLNEALRRPIYSADDLDEEKNVLKGEIRRRNSNPAYTLFVDLNRNLWKENYTRKIDPNDYMLVEDFDSALINKYRRKYFYPENSLLVISGDVDHNKMLTAASNIFSEWTPSPESSSHETTIPKFDTLRYIQSFITESEITRIPMIILGFQGPDTEKRPDDIYPGIILAYLMSDNNSTLQKKLVGSGMAYNVSVNFQPLKTGSQFYITMVPEMNSINKSVESLKKQLNLWSDESYISGEELALAKKQVINEELFAREKLSDQIHLITERWAKSDLNFYTDYVKKIESVTKDDIKNFIKEYVKDKPYIIGALASPELYKSTNLAREVRDVKPVEKYAALFATSSYNITDSAGLAILKDIAYLMQINPNAKLKVHGYADWRGPADLNQRLSEKRAEAAKNMIIKTGNISRDRIEAIGHGELEKTDDPKEMEKNRSVKFEITFTENNKS